MIWFDLKELERKISSDELSDKEAFHYVLAQAIVLALSFESSSWVDPFWLKFVGRALLVLITIWGLHKAYKANDEVDGRDFLKRYFAIRWVIGVRIVLVVLLFSFIIGGIVGIVTIMSGGSDQIAPSYRSLIATASVLLLEILSYVLIVNSIRRLHPNTMED